MSEVLPNNNLVYFIFQHFLANYIFNLLRSSFLQSKDAKASGTLQAEATAAVSDGDVTSKLTNQFALLEFERPVTCPADSLVIGSRLDADAYILDLETSNPIPWPHG